MIDRSRSEYSIMNILTGFGGYFLNTLLGYICRIVFVQCLNAWIVNKYFINVVIG